MPINWTLKLGQRVHITGFINNNNSCVCSILFAFVFAIKMSPKSFPLSCCSHRLSLSSSFCIRISNFYNRWCANMQSIWCKCCPKNVTFNLVIEISMHSNFNLHIRYQVASYVKCECIIVSASPFHFGIILFPSEKRFFSLWF